MDFENFDEEVFNPEQTALNRYLQISAVFLVATFVLPIDRGPVNVWDRFGIDGALVLVRLSLPALVGLGFAYLAWLTRLRLGPKAAITFGLLALLLVVGQNPFEVLRIVFPPIGGDLGEEMFGMYDGQYFPREDALHLALLGCGLVLLGAAGRYRTARLTSMIGIYGLLAAALVIGAYYLVPYAGGRVPAVRNFELYRSFYRAAESLDAAEVKLGGQLKLSAGYFMAIYFVPILLVIVSAGAWLRSRYRGHRAVFAKLAGWGAPAYLLAFLLPMLFKEAMRETGHGFLPNVRSYVLLATILVGLTLAVPMVVEKYAERGAGDERLPDDPLAWKEQHR